MVSISNLLEWKPGVLGEVADDLVSKRKKLEDLQDEFDGGKPPSTWVAGSASRAHTAHDKLRSRLNDIAAEVSDVAVNLDDAQTRIKTAKQALQDALEMARVRGFEVNHATGRVTDPKEYDDPGEVINSQNQVDAVFADIDAALTAAQEADLDLAAALKSAVDGETDGGDGTIADAVNQTPERMDDMTPEELADLLGEDVTIHTISAYLELEAEIGSFDFEGKAQADYRVTADGTTFLALHLEAGLGRSIKVGGQEADVGAGGTVDLELKFSSPEEAQEFLRDLKDRALDDVDGWDVLQGDVPIEIADNVARYVGEQDIDSFRTGAYVQGSAEFDSPWARGAIEGRAEGYYDWQKDTFGLKIQASGDAELGSKDSGYDASAQLSGEIKIKDGDFDSFTLAGKMEGTVANERLGIPMPANTATGAGLDVQLTVDSENPALPEIKAALEDGDVGRAKDLALDNGQLVVRETVVEKYSEEDFKFGGGPVRVEAGWGASGETATTVWFRDAGRDQVVQVNTADLPVNQGR